MFTTLPLLSKHPNDKLKGPVQFVLASLTDPPGDSPPVPVITLPIALRGVTLRGGRALTLAVRAVRAIMVLYKCMMVGGGGMLVEVGGQEGLGRWNVYSGYLWACTGG
jgi:hypothetical protein